GQQPVPAPGPPGDADRDARPVVRAPPVRAVAGGDAPPGARRQRGDHLVHAACAVTETEDIVVAPGGQHVRRVVLFEPHPQVLGLPVPATPAGTWPARTPRPRSPTRTAPRSRTPAPASPAPDAAW